MIELGKKQKLTVVKSVDFGVYLGEDMQADAKNRVLLPSRQVPEGTKEGDSIEAFIYKDSQDRLIATTKEPKLQVGQTAVLKVSQVTRIGAFLDWGLEKDLLLPYHEQTLKVREGEDVLVALYIDKSSRLCATMKVYHYLSTRTPYVVGDMVKGRVYEISDRFGVFVAVDDKYSALIPAREAKGKYRPGKILELRVSEVKEDGKMNVTDRQKAYLQINEDAENVLEVINEFAGVLPFDDKASPEVIQREFGLSKAAFKRAVGHLMKEKQYEKALEVGEKSLKTDSSLTMLRIACLNETGELGSRLFTYPLVGGSKAMMPDSVTVKTMMWKAPKWMQKPSAWMVKHHLKYRLPVDYQLCALLLDKQLDKFVAEVQKHYKVTSGKLPVHYKEALRRVQEPTQLRDRHLSVLRQIQVVFLTFISRVRNGLFIGLSMLLSQFSHHGTERLCVAAV